MITQAVREALISFKPKHDDFLSVTEAAKFLNLSESHVRELRRIGDLKGYKRGNRLYFKREDLEKRIKG